MAYPTISALTARAHILTESALVAEAAQFIKKNCQPYLNANPQLLPLWRGFDSSGRDLPGVFTYPVRDDRRAMAMPREEAVWWNGVIVDAGKVARRDNSAMCTGNVGSAMVFGDAYVVFPVGPFNYTWFPEIEDANLTPRSPGSEAPECRGDDGSLGAAIRSGNEIMVRPVGRELYAVHISHLPYLMRELRQ